MSPLRSFRARMIVGSLVWTLGLLAVTTIVGGVIVHHNPRLIWFVHNSTLVLFATILLVGGLSMLRRGLSPFVELRDRLAEVRDGRNRRVEGSYPTEVQPLVDDLNALLEHRERVVTRALAKAGDLAHGLKTPLAVLQHEANVADANGQRELAVVIGQQVDRMRRQVDYHLAQARAAGSGAAPGARCAVAESVEGLARALRRLQAERGPRGVQARGRAAARRAGRRDGAGLRPRPRDRPRARRAVRRLDRTRDRGRRRAARAADPAGLLTSNLRTSSRP